MGRRASPPASQAAALAACLLLAALPSAHTQTDILPGECATLPFDFNWQNFDYQAAFSSSSNLTQGCTLQISRLYMRGTCTSQRNNGGQGCGSGGGSVVNATSCEAVFADAPSGAILSPPVPSTSYAFDSGSLCTQTDVGYFFARYLCNSTTNGTVPLPVPLRFDVALNWKKYSGGCGGSSVPSWARYFVGVIAAMVAVALLAFAFKRCCQKRTYAAPAVVQLAPPGHPAAAAGGNPYYTGSAAYGAGVEPPAYAGAWGATPAGYPPTGATPAGYPPGSGYAQPAPYGAYGGGGYGGPQPPHQPPPMTTVTLGQPAGEEGGGAVLPATVGSGLHTQPSGPRPGAGGDATSKV